MPPIEELKKYLLCPRYRNILDECGKLVPPKSDVFKEISDLLGKRMSPKYIYTVILANRYGMYDALLSYHCIEKPFNVTASSVDDDESFNQTLPTNELHFTVPIPLKIWHDIDCENIIYKSNAKVQRNYSTLRRGKWTTEIFDLVYKEAKLPCAFMFKRCTISETGIYATIRASCADCKCSLTAKIVNKPVKNTDIRLECCVADFDPSIKHEKKRPLKGEKRIEVSKSLASGSTSATTWRRKVANDMMNLYDEEPPHLYKVETLRKAKQERVDIDLKIKGTCALKSLQSLKYGEYAGSIHSIGYDPFFVHYWTSEQVAVYLDYHETLYIDATGSLVKKLPLPNGEQSAHIYLYQAVSDTLTYKMPVFQMLSAVQNVNAIQFWLFEFLRIGGTHKSGFPIPRTVVCDFDKALLNAIAKAFGQCTNLKQYLTTCYTLLLNERKIEIPPCFIRLDICHYMHFISRWKIFVGLHHKVKKFYLLAMALLTKQTNFTDFVDLAKSIIILSLSEDLGRNKEGYKVPGERACSVITSKIKGIDDDVKTFEQDSEENKFVEYDMQLEDCNVVIWAHHIIDECRKTVTLSGEGDNINAYYVPELCNKLKNLLYYFPLFTGVMIPIFGYGKVNISSAAVEAEMKDVKHVLLRKDSRPMRADKFVSRHIASFEGRAKLAMASQEWSIKVTSTETSPLTEHESNVECNKSLENTMTGLTSPVELDVNITELPTCKLQKRIQEKDSVPITSDCVSVIETCSDTELNMEHNWRNKNLSHKIKRRTYLDARPDWDASKLSKTCIGVGNLQNGSICPLVNDHGRKIIIRNTCSFDSIISIVTSACTNEKYRDEICNSKSDTMSLVQYFLKYGCCAAVYRQRAHLLMKIEPFVSELQTNIITIDCYASIGNVAQYILADDPSYTETKYCHVCLDTRIRKSTIVPINVNMLKDHGFSRLADAIKDGMPSKKPVCCNEQMKINVQYGPHIIVECDPAEYQSCNKQRLSDFPKEIQVGNICFVLAGVIARYGGTGRRSGHYVGYAYQMTRWIEFDDMIKNSKQKSDAHTVLPHLLIYVVA